MADQIPLAEAAELLGVSVERVRQLVVTGRLPGQRVANAWVVRKDDIVARRHSPGVRGRPLGQHRAWQEIIAGRIDLKRPGRYQRRAAIVRGEMSGADADALPELVGALMGGVRAAIELGEQLAISGDVSLYLSASSFARIDSLVAFVPNAEGGVVIRVVDDDVWPAIPKAALAPRAAVALDLLESGDPRHWIAGEHLADLDG